MDASITQLAFPAFLAGIFMFLAPCTLPLVPAFLGFIGGVSLSNGKVRELTREDRIKIITHTAIYVLGFSFIFVILGLGASTLGSFLRQYQGIILRLSGVLIIFFGFLLLGVVKLRFFEGVRSLPIFRKFQKPGKLGSFVMGVAFATGWTPCAGPIVGSILTIAAANGRALEGAMLLSIFSLGLAIPFLFTAFFFGWVLTVITKFTRYLEVLYKLSGVFLIGIGIILFTNNFTLLIELGYGLFNFLNYQDFLFRFL